jgi:hypothetical protein
MLNEFESSNEYQQGLAGETAISRWLRKRGNYVLPIYEKIIDDGKGPRLFAPDGALVAPDVLIFKGANILWVEAKHKSGFSWNRVRQELVTGIDLRHYLQYLKIVDNLSVPLWLFFLHSGAPTKDCPFENTPSGLFAEDINNLRHNESHRSEKWGRTGMVYWSIKSLKKLAEYKEVLNS